MNKTLIALAVAAASISSVNAAEVYSDETSSLAVGGRFEARGCNWLTTMQATRK